MDHDDSHPARAPRAPGRPRVFGVAVAVATLIAALAAPPTAGGEPAAGAAESIRGSVLVLERGLLGAARPARHSGGVLVYVTGFREPPPVEAAVLDQQDQQFSPRLLPVVAGQAVVFPNRDPIYHNVFSVSAAEPFDLGQYRDSDPPRRQVFATPGLVPVYCNIHPEMISYVVVLENSSYTVTDKDGSFEIRGVPAHVPSDGLRVNAWMPSATRVSAGLEGGSRDEVIELELQRTARVVPHKRKDGSDYPPPGYQEDE